MHSIGFWCNYLLESGCIIFQSQEIVRDTTLLVLFLYLSSRYDVDAAIFSLFQSSCFALKD